MPGRVWGESAWALIEPAEPSPESNWWDRFWYRRQYGSGWVVNHFFASAEQCRTVEKRWQAEAAKIMGGSTRSLHDTLRATHLITSRCVPAAALPIFNVLPGNGFPSR